VYKNSGSVKDTYFTVLMEERERDLRSMNHRHHRTKEKRGADKNVVVTFQYSFIRICLVGTWNGKNSFGLSQLLTSTLPKLVILSL